MDGQEFEITVEELYENIGKRLDTAAVDGVDRSGEEQQMTLDFDDASTIRFTIDSEKQSLYMSAPDGDRSFYYHEIEECWFERNTEMELFTILQKAIGDRTGKPVLLTES